MRDRTFEDAKRHFSECETALFRGDNYANLQLSECENHFSRFCDESKDFFNFSFVQRDFAAWIRCLIRLSSLHVFISSISL